MPSWQRHRVSCKPCHLRYNKAIKQPPPNVALQGAKYNETCFLYKDIPESTDEIYLSVCVITHVVNEKLQVLLFMLKIRNISDRTVVK